jgi:hypothetical protein
MKLREFLIRVDELLSKGGRGAAAVGDAEALFRAFADELERRAKVDLDGVHGARQTADKVRGEIAARFADYAAKGLSEADPVFAVLQRLERLATRERDKWWRRRA